MLDLSLADYFGTVALSLFTILTSAIILHMLYRFKCIATGNNEVPSFYHNILSFVEIKNTLGNHIFFPIFISTFCLGVILELHTDYFTDSTTSHGIFMKWSQEVFNRDNSM
ncbi:MAG TPA: hypothetical protein VG603_16575, partial [Chitinophagales bacterium]|nr:hypothetical protein [Chitinophagales bacterium]